MIWVLVWFALAILYFALVGRHKLILSPEEEFAMEHQAKADRLKHMQPAAARGRRRVLNRSADAAELNEWPEICTSTQLKKAVAAATIDTVLACVVDMQGRLVGKRFQAQYFVDSAL